MKVDRLKGLFGDLERERVDWIVLRKHDHIPDKISISEDIDLLCKREQRDGILRTYQSAGYAFHEDPREYNTYLYGAYPHDHFVDKENDIHVDIVYKLSYRSPNRGEWIPVHEELQSDIWDNIVEVGAFWKYKASPVDELIHILCHCIFDKRACLPYYRTLIRELIGHTDTRLLSRKLELIFFSFAPKLVEYILSDDMDGIFEKYITFKDY